MKSQVEGPVRHHKRPRVPCKRKGCTRKAVFDDDGLCGPCADAASARQFAIIDSYLLGAARGRKEP